MIAKKNSRYDLERKRIVLFQIGLLTAGSFTLAAFSYTSPLKVEKEKMAVKYQPIEYLLETPIEIKKEEPIRKNELKTPDKPSEPNFNLDSKKITSDLKVVNNTSVLPKPDIDMPGFGKLVDVHVEVDPGDVEEFPLLEAEYIGGFAEMKKHVQSTLVYPEEDIHLGNQGVVYVSFVIEKDGSVSNVKIERGVSRTIDREAKRIVNSFPKWKAGENAYGKVRTRVRMPFNFELVE